MSILSRIFGGGDDEPDLETRLSRLEAEAEGARAGARAFTLNRAGDVALQGDQTERAITLYGRAIDAYLEDQHLDAARGVANKIVRVHPDAVRTLCTLTWLDLASRHTATALLHLRDYVEAAERAGNGSIAVTQIHHMAKLVPLQEFRAAAADALDRLDRPEIAGNVREWRLDEPSKDVVEGEQELAEACMRAAVDIARRTD